MPSTPNRSRAPSTPAKTPLSSRSAAYPRCKILQIRDATFRRLRGRACFGRRLHTKCCISSGALVRNTARGRSARRPNADKPGLSWGDSSDGFEDGDEPRRTLLGQRFVFKCPKAPAKLSGRRVYGTDRYAFNSYVCLAAVHAGRLTMDGGFVAVQMVEPAGKLEGSTRNGVESKSGPAGDRQLIFLSPGPEFALNAGR